MKLRIEQDLSDSLPYQVYLEGEITADFRNRMSAIDAWCESTWGAHDITSEYEFMHRGWAFMKESDAVLLFLTWGSA
jgi:hypothetical protein